MRLNLYNKQIANELLLDSIDIQQMTTQLHFPLSFYEHPLMKYLG